MKAHLESSTRVDHHPSMNSSQRFLWIVSCLCSIDMISILESLAMVPKMLGMESRQSKMFPFVQSLTRNSVSGCVSFVKGQLFS